MAIRIEDKTPQLGRITLPKGTFLSNPSTAADGGLGLGGATLPPTPQINMWGNVTPGYNAVQLPMAGVADPNPFARYQRTENIFQMADRVLPIAGGAPGQDAAARFINSVFSPQAKPTGMLDKVTSPTQQSVAYQTGLPAGAVPGHQVNQIGATDGLTPEQVRQQMVSAGYSLQYRSGVGEVWVPRAGAAGMAGGNAIGGATDSRGRPEFVDGASLAPGQDVTDARGNRYVGGTPAPDGTAQYALNLANPAARNDTKGRYKWVSEVRKDANGNWVRINRQVLRKVYTRSHLKNRSSGTSGGGRQGDGQPTNPADMGRENNQLVNFRVNYG